MAFSRQKMSRWIAYYIMYFWEAQYLLDSEPSQLSAGVLETALKYKICAVPNIGVADPMWNAAVSPLVHVLEARMRKTLLCATSSYNSALLVPHAVKWDMKA